MYGEFEPEYIYGFIDSDNNTNFIFNDEDLTEHGLSLFADSLVRMNIGGAIYGIPLPLTKKATVEQKKQVKNCIEKLKGKYTGIDNVEIGYFLGLSGDWDICHNQYPTKINQ
jgi:hypothetical protein